MVLSLGGGDAVHTCAAMLDNRGDATFLQKCLALCSICLKTFVVHKSRSSIGTSSLIKTIKKLIPFMRSFNSCESFSLKNKNPGRSGGLAEHGGNTFTFQEFVTPVATYIV